MECKDNWRWDITDMFKIFLFWGSKFEGLEWSHTTAMIMITVGKTTRTLYYTTSGGSTLSHRRGPGLNPSQFMWDLFFWGGGGGEHLDRFLSNYCQFPISTIAQIFCTHSFVYHWRYLNLSNEDDFEKHPKNSIRHDMKYPHTHP
jgi:hypothetical protein